MWEIFVSHWLPPPPRSGTPTRVPKPLPFPGPRKLPLQHPLGSKFNTAATFLGNLKKKKKELRAGGCEGEGAKGRCRGVLYLSREGYHRAASQPAWAQWRGVGHPGGCIRSPRGPGPEREGKFLGQKRHPGWWQPKTPSAGELGLWAVPLLSSARRRMLSHPFSAARARPLFFPLASQLWPRTPPLRCRPAGGLCRNPLRMRPT